MNVRPALLIPWICFAALALTACTAGSSIPTQPPQPPDEYLSNALDWIETHSVKITSMDWQAVRQQAMALASGPRTVSDTYPALLFVSKQLGDSATYFLPPDPQKKIPDSLGLMAFYPEAVILSIDPGGPADAAGLRVGDVIEAIDGSPPRQWQGTKFVDWYDNQPVLQVRVQRPGQNAAIAVTLKKVEESVGPPPGGRRISTGQGDIGYVEVPQAGGSWESYPTLIQQVIRDADGAATCGWILDLRRNWGGDIWYQIAAVGPILGQGEVGGFAYLDGRHELWEYRDGKVFWDGDERPESLVEGSIYRLKHPLPPVALLTGPATLAAGELAVVTFKGRPEVRSFGEPTGGSPFLVYHTSLSDGAFLGISGAFSMDRMGRIYDGPIPPDEVVPTDWTLFGTDHDPVILAARDWLLSRPACRGR